MDSFLTRSAKKLEQALGVPRPWELTPATAIGYQMTMGGGPIGERARKGTAQFIGRYATNIKKPYGYDLPELDVVEGLKSVARDQPQWISRLQGATRLPTPAERGATEEEGAREVLYREMFDLPPRLSPSSLEKIGPKEYALSREEQPRPKPLVFPHQHSVHHGVMGNVLLTPSKEDGYSYRDVWDIVSPKATEERWSPTMAGSISSRLRKLIAPILRPATVSGEVPAP
jgi:hypothetical protein